MYSDNWLKSLLY